MLLCRRLFIKILSPPVTILVPAVLDEFAVAFYDAEHDALIHVLPLLWRKRHHLVHGAVCFLYKFSEATV